MTKASQKISDFYKKFQTKSPEDSAHDQSYFEYEQSHEDSQLLSETQIKMEVSDRVLSPAKEDPSLQMLKQIEQRRMELTSRSNSPPQANVQVDEIHADNSPPGRRRKPSAEQQEIEQLILKTKKGLLGDEFVQGLADTQNPN